MQRATPWLHLAFTSRGRILYFYICLKLGSTRYARLVQAKAIWCLSGQLLQQATRPLTKTRYRLSSSWRTGHSAFYYVHVSRPRRKRCADPEEGYYLLPISFTRNLFLTAIMACERYNIGAKTYQCS